LRGVGSFGFGTVRGLIGLLLLVGINLIDLFCFQPGFETTPQLCERTFFDARNPLFGYSHDGCDFRSGSDGEAGGFS
jgi:hypothetical protein